MDVIGYHRGFRSCFGGCVAEYTVCVCRVYSLAAAVHAAQRPNVAAVALAAALQARVPLWISWPLCCSSSTFTCTPITSTNSAFAEHSSLTSAAASAGFSRILAPSRSKMTLRNSNTNNTR